MNDMNHEIFKRYEHVHLIITYFIKCTSFHNYQHSFPTRRSSDLARRLLQQVEHVGAEHDGATAEKTAQAEEGRSEEHTSELQSRLHLVCRLLLEKKKKIIINYIKIYYTSIITIYI